MLMKIRELVRRRAGQGTVEFALMAPFFFLLLVGGFDFGRAGFYYVTTADLARNGARMASAYDTGTGATDASITSLIKQQAKAITFADLTQPAACGTSTPPSPLTACYQPAVGSGFIFIDRSGFASFPKYVQVSVVYHFEATTPMVRALMSTNYFVGTATMETEY
jgi:Flp pilus assembly protein TadG